MFSLTSCNKPEYTSFKEYTEIVTNASETQRNIFVFTATNCGFCQKVLPFIEQYKNENTDPNLNVHILSVDHWVYTND